LLLLLLVVVVVAMVRLGFNGVLVFFNQ